MLTFGTAERSEATPADTATISNTVGQPNGNSTALPLVEASIRNNPNLYPTDEVMQRLHA